MITEIVWKAKHHAVTKCTDDGLIYFEVYNLSREKWQYVYSSFKDAISKAVKLEILTTNTKV